MHAALVLLTALAASLGPAGPAAAGSQLGGEGPLRNDTPLPGLLAAEEALAAGDELWVRALDAAAADRSSLRSRAFDAWRAALTDSRPGDAVRLVSGYGESDEPTFPDPDGTHARRAEDATVAVLRRLAAIPAADRGAWSERFEALAADALGVELGRSVVSDLGLVRIERTFPATRSAARAALALADLALESARPSAARVWIDRARTHLDLLTDIDGAFQAAIERRDRFALRALRGIFVGDHTGSQPPLRDLSPGADASADRRLRLIAKHRISGVARSPQEPYGRGLGSGLAFFRDGAALVQGAYGLLLVDPLGASGRPEELRVRFDDLFGTSQPLLSAAASSGGWKAHPASDGARAAVVIGRGERTRPLENIRISPTGNALGVLTHGSGDSPLEPLWVVRDGLSIDPRQKPRRGAGDLVVPGEFASREPVDGWDFGRGWEFQPAPVFVDDRLFVLARGLGDSTAEDQNHADEVRLVAFDAASGDVLWSREITTERGLGAADERGRAAFFATTTMPLNVDRRSGHLLVGTNVGLLCAYDVADGRLAWAIQNQRRREGDVGWPGSRAPILVPDPRVASGAAAWFAPFDSDFLYALPAGPAALDGSLFVEAPRARRTALDVVAVAAPRDSEKAASVVLYGRDGRHAALLLEDPSGRRRPASYLAPDERFAGRAAVVDDGLYVAGTRELGLFGVAGELRLVDAAPIPSYGAGRGGDVVVFRG
ncbi:MAG: PQQ-binding-like beta-propeller repeat protein, partial [Planctomycetota bacterium]